MTLDTGDIRRALAKKGFEPDSTHHWMYWLIIDGKKTSVRTRVSHNMREIGDHLIGQMSKQTCLRKAEFVQLIECTYSGDAYIADMKKKLGLS